MSLTYQIRELSLVFGNNPKPAFDLIKRNFSRESIYSKTKQTVALSQVSLEINRGDFVVLMGLSGSGKSSLLRCLNGLNGRTPNSSQGEVLLFPRDSSEPIPLLSCKNQVIQEVRRYQVSMVFQQFALLPWKTVTENIAYPLEIQGLNPDEIDKRVKEQISLVQLNQWKNSYPNELSGGMQQRVGIARALATHADILLMDEPFSALDPIHRRALQNELLELKATLSKTIVFVTHDLDEGLRLATQLAIIDEGCILQSGKPSDILKNPKSARIQEFTSYVS